MPQAPPQREVQQDIVSLAHGPDQGSSWGLVLPFAGILAHDKVWAYRVGLIHTGLHEPPNDVIDVAFPGGKQCGQELLLAQLHEEVVTPAWTHFQKALCSDG